MSRPGQLGVALALLVSLASTGCIAKLFEEVPPPVPDGYPQLETAEDGRAELVINGESYVTENGGATSFNREGGFEDQLRATTSFDYRLTFTYRDIEVREYTVASGDLEVSDGLLDASVMCGGSSLKIVGKDRWDDNLYGERDVMWGVISVRMCGTEYDAGVGDFVPVERELTGRFSSIVSEH